MAVDRRKFIFFLVLSVLFCVVPVWSRPEDDEGYSGWFSKRDTASSDSSLPPPPGTLPQKKLDKCSLESALAIDEVENIVYLDKTLVVDGCLLDCENKILRSTVDVGSLVKIRNGGHVKNCNVQFIKKKNLQEGLAKIDGLEIDLDSEDDEEFSGTIQPTSWGTYYASSEASQRLTYYNKATSFYNNAVAGFLCERGDCNLENSECSGIESEPNAPPASLLLMQQCVLILKGAENVRIEGGLVKSYNRPVSIMGIVVNAGEKAEDAKVRLFVDNVTIQSQVGNGILVAGGASAVRISESTVSGNGLSGIVVNHRYGIDSFAVLGGSIEDNGKNGIDLIAEAQVLISDVLLKTNGEDGVKVRRVENLSIDNAIIDENRMTGINIWNAKTISLQGVISKNNYQNGLSLEASDAIVDIANSVFLENGFNLGQSPQWKRAGIYAWLAKKITITNSVSNGNSMDGIIIYDVNDLEFTGVDTMKNGNDGIEIRESIAAYGHDYTMNSDYLVGAYYYPWHGDDFHNDAGYLREMLLPPQAPTLGEYDDSDPEVISQHLAWFRKSNIGLVVTSWWGPNRSEDTTTRDVLMEHSYLGNLKVALHYETKGRIKEENGNDMSTVEDDIQYMCENYFNHENYYKVDGRPVLFIYISRKLEELGTLEYALLSMRSTASKCGHNLYIVGDAVFAKAPDEAKKSFSYLDAVTNYDVYGSSGGPKQETPYAGTERIDKYYEEQEKWRDLAHKENCRFIPAVSPGYNDRGVRFDKNNPPVSRRLTESSEEGSLFKYQLEKALPLVDPQMDKLILVNSFNEWHEDTQIEPVAAVNENEGVTIEPQERTFGVEYEAYGELYLDILFDATKRPVSKKEHLNYDTYIPTKLDFSNVRSCENENDGMRFYITQNSIDDQTELVIQTGARVISCENQDFDYMMYGGGNVEFFAQSSHGIVGDQCANGYQMVASSATVDGCEFSTLMKDCSKSDCKPRDILTIGGGVITDHKVQ